MGRQKCKTFDDTITKYVRTQFIKQAAYTGLLLFVVSIVVFAASVKFSTDRYVRGLCAEVGQSARILVETSQMKSYEGYFADIVRRLQDQLKIDDLSFLSNSP